MRSTSTVRKLAFAIATLGLGAAVLVPATSSFGASGPVSVVDYSQCANGQPPSTAVTCTGGWINGILQANNSHFRESEVTPQRAVVKVNTNAASTCAAATTQGPAVTTGCHSFTLTYQARKGTTHAYDSLATWNHTVTGADRCAGLTNPVKSALDCSGTPTPSTLAITADPTAVKPSATGVSEVTSVHDLNGQQLEMFGGGTLVDMTVPEHDAAQLAGDDYATTTIYYAATVGQTIELLFGGHLAVGPTSRVGWGDGLGASNINGGPYHIKWAAADGSSVGSRDNQIMGSSIGELPASTVSTIHSYAVSLSDTATVGDLSGIASPGTFSFRLFRAPLGTTTDQCNASYEITLASTFSGVSAPNPAANTAADYASSPSFSTATTGNGVYNWIATYSGDATQQASSSSCGSETTTVNVS